MEIFLNGASPEPRLKTGEEIHMVSGQREVTNLHEATTGIFPGKVITPTKLPCRRTVFKISQNHFQNCSPTHLDCSLK